MSLQIFKNEKELDVKSFLFPAGEVGVKLASTNYAYLHGNGNYQTILARIKDGSGLMEVALVKDALERLSDIPIRLIMPYVPYARQDRACVEGEAFSLKVFAEMINSLLFDKVTIFDPHSDVCGAVFNRLQIYTQLNVIEKYDEFAKRVIKGVTFVSPDAGANKKTFALASYFGHKEFIRADKVRDLATGEIKETVVHGPSLEGVDCVIADDICDGGRTFIELAKALKIKGARKVILYVTHGIFTKGTKVLYDGGVDEIYTTDSYFEVWPAGCNPTNTLKLFSMFKP